MVNISEARIRWQTPTGGTGYSVMHFGFVTTNAEAQTLIDNLQDFCQNIAVVLPNQVSLGPDSEVRVLDDATGVMQNVFAGTAPPDTVGSGGSSYAEGVGCSITWDTNSVVNGRRLRGRTFIVPLASGVYTNTGEVGTTFLSNIQGPADTLRIQATPRVWSRPKPDATPPREGVSAPVLSSTARASVAWLRSRKD